MVTYKTIRFDLYMEETIQRLMLESKTSSADIFTGAFKRMHLCFGNRPIYLSEITATWVFEFRTYLTSCNLSANTINTYLNVTRNVYKRAIQTSHLKDHQHPFQHTSITVEPLHHETPAAGLLKRMRHLRLDGHQHLCFSRDLFLFSQMAGKMSFRDMAFLKKKDVQMGYLHFTRSRSGCQYTVLLTPAMKAIIHTYQGQGIYLFPIIRQPDKDLYQQYRSGLRKYNIHLNKLAKLLDTQMSLNTLIMFGSMVHRQNRKPSSTIGTEMLRGLSQTQAH
jgi:hypothetical protein